MSYETRSVARLVAAIILVFLLGLPLMASAQSSYHVRFAEAENAIHTYEPTITWWEQQSQITEGIWFIIVALGIATCALQALTRPWTRPATLAAGAFVAALTFFNTTFFDGDHKTLMNRAREGRTLIELADKVIALAPSLPTDDDREAALSYIQEGAEGLAQLVGGGSKGRPVASPDRSASMFQSPFATLFAAGTECGCTGFRKQDSQAYRYSCGEGMARSLSEARIMATDHAVAQATRSLQKAQSRTLAADLAAYVRSVSAEVAACPVSGTRGFTMFVLLRVPTTLTSAGAQQAFNPASTEN